MSVEKKINYNMQGGVRNYLGKQKEVKAPLKWQSSPDHPTTELAYITQAEKDLLVKQDLHGSLKGGVNKGPYGIMSLNGGGFGSEDKGTNNDGSANSGGGGNARENYRTSQYTAPKAQVTTTVTSPRTNRVTGAKIPDYKITRDKIYSPKSKIGFGPKGKDTYHQDQLKNIKKSLKEVNPGFFDSGLGKFIKTIGLTVIAPQLLAGTKLGTLYSGYNKAKGLANLAKSFNITDENVVTSLADTVKDKFAGFKTTKRKGPKDPPDDRGNGNDGNQQNALMAEYLLLLQKMEQGILQKEEQGRFNSLKSRLGKAYGGIMNVNMNRGQLGVMNG
jgi:hypothetical protein